MAATWLAVMVATAAAYAPLAPRRRGTRLQMSDDSWAQELAQAGGGFERQEASRWQKSDRGKADAESRIRWIGVSRWSRGPADQELLARHRSRAAFLHAAELR